MDPIEFRPVLRVVGFLLCGMAGVMLGPTLVDLAAHNSDWQTFLASAGVTAFFGGTLVATTAGDPARQPTKKQAFVLTALCWVVLPGFAALPLRGLGLSFTDAFFESVSGVTTTGSTVLVGLDGLPPGILIWRSLLQWVGGVGIIMMAILMLPFLRIGGMQLFQAESSERSEKILPRAFQLATWISLVYLLLTAACAIAYAATGMSSFDAVNHAMTTLATGGYSTHDASFGYFANPATHWVATLFMLAGALPFVAHIRLAKGHGLALWRDPQAKVLGGFLLVVSLILALWLMANGDWALADALRLSAFNVVSVVTTTGFANADYGSWGSFAVAVFLILTFVGGCTGSTAGGIKIYRFQVLGRAIRVQLLRLISPRRVTVMTYNGRRLTPDVLGSVLAFIAVFLATVALFTIALSAMGLDLVTALSASATAIGNVGPGLGPTIGPAGNFASLPDGSKWLLSAAMLLGRLELFTVLVMCDPQFWRS